MSRTARVTAKGANPVGRLCSPDTPDPHWQLVDSDGNVYLVDRLKKKVLGDNYQKEIVVPSYVKNVSKVVIWCAWAEANLGESNFSSPVN